MAQDYIKDFFIDGNDNLLRNLLPPLYYTMHIWGLVPPAFHHQKSTLSIRNVWLLFVIVLCTGSNVANRLRLFLQNESFVTMYDSVNVVLRSLVCLVSVIHLFANQKSIVQVFNAFSRTVRNLKHAQIRKKMLLLMLLFSFYFTGISVIALFHTTSCDGSCQKEYFNLYLYGIDCPHFLPSEICSLLMLVDWGVYNVVVSLTGILIFMYVGICYICKNASDEFKLSISMSVRRSVKAEEVHHLQDKFCKLQALIQRIDDIYSPLVLLWYVDLVVNLTISVPNIISLYLDKVHMSLIYPKLFNICYFITTFLVTSLAAADTNENLQETLVNVYKMISRVSIHDCETHKQMLLLSKQMMSKSGFFTGWRCFVLNRQFIVTVVSGVVTSTVFLVQNMTQQSVDIVI